MSSSSGGRTDPQHRPQTTPPTTPRRSGIFFPVTWMVCSFLPICAKRSAKGPKDFKAVRSAAISSSIALCFYLVMIIILMTVGRDRWQRRVCVDRFGNRFYCSRKLL